jgi:hypothetical protein
VDARHRFLACEQARVKPEFREWTGKGSLVAFVISENVPRRHLTATQRAVIGRDYVSGGGERAPEDPRRNSSRKNEKTLLEIDARDQAADVVLKTDLPEHGLHESKDKSPGRKLSCMAHTPNVCRTRIVLGRS